MKVEAARDDGALLVTEGKAAAIVLGDKHWITDRDSALARSGWQPNAGTVPSALAAVLQPELDGFNDDHAGDDSELDQSEQELAVALDESPPKPVPEVPPLRSAALPLWLIRTSTPEELRRYSPSQKRDPNGEWGDGVAGASALKDALKLAERIQLGPDEHLASSDLLPGDDADLTIAVISSPHGNHVRIGVIPSEDSGKWKAANLGGTTMLDQDGLDDLHRELTAANSEAKKLARQADKAWESGGPPTDPVLTGDAPVAEGRIFSDWSDVFYHVWLTDDEPTQWKTTLQINPGDAPAEDEGGIALGPKELAKLLRKLADVNLSASPPASRTRDPKEALVYERYNDQHAPAGSSTGGQFAAGGGSGQAKKPSPPKRRPDGHHPPRKPASHGDSGTLAYDATSNHGTGYNSKIGDPRVHTLQQALIRLGIKDSQGKDLKDDGKLGPKTTSAVKALQTRLGLKPDGKVTPALLAQIKSMKSLPATKKRSAAMDYCVRAFGFEFEERGQRNGDGRTLEGYAAVFNSPTRIAAVGGDFDEVISPGAFTRSIRSRMPVLQFEHGRDPRVGAVPIGSIEDLSEDSQGLHVRAKLYDNPVVEPVRQAIEGRSIKGMSFRFNVVDNGDTWARRNGAIDLRTVGDADVHELGPVVFPAYDTTTVSVRSLLAQLGPEEHRALLRELAYDLRSLDLDDTARQPTARSSGSGDTGMDDGNAEEHLSIRQRLDQGALRTRGILK